VFHEETVVLKLAYLRKDGFPYVKSPRHEEVWESGHASLTSVLNGGVCSTSRSGCLDHLSDVRLSHRVSLDTVTKRKSPPLQL
jgi:hypothetical protein